MKKYIKNLLVDRLFFNQYMKRVQEYHELPSSSIDEIKNNIFLKLYKLVLKRSQFYQRLYSDHGLNYSSISSIDDIKALPIISKKDIKTKPDELLTISKMLCQKGYTSGTSGSPLSVYRDLNSIQLENAYRWYHRYQNGLNIRDKIISLRGDLDKNELYKFDKFNNVLYISSYNINEKNFNKIFELISTYQPKGAIGYPSSLFFLANLFKKFSRKVRIPLIFTSSETLFDFQVQLIEQVFEASLIDRYGNAERTISLCQYKSNCGYYESPAYSINEYNKDFVVTTSLISKAFPLIRYKVEDSIEVGTNGEIKKINGRTDDYIILPDGTKVGRVDFVFKELDCVEIAQIIQTNKKSIDVNLVVNKNFNDTEKNKIISKFKDRIGHDIHIYINIVEEKEIIKTSANKYRLVINKTLNEENNLGLPQI